MAPSLYSGLRVYRMDLQRRLQRAALLVGRVWGQGDEVRQRLQVEERREGGGHEAGVGLEAAGVKGVRVWVWRRPRGEKFICRGGGGGDGGDDGGQRRPGRRIRRRRVEGRTLCS